MQACKSESHSPDMRSSDLLILMCLCPEQLMLYLTHVRNEGVHEAEKAGKRTNKMK